jgi:flagellar hook-associated protein 3 FlgL
MRVSSSTLFDASVAEINQQQARMLQTQQQISSGRKFLTAADDPVAATRALEVSQADAMNTQFASNRGAVKDTLTLAETYLQGVTSLLQDVRDGVLVASGGSVSNSDRQTIAANFSGRLQELVGLANSTDGAGQYLFAGFQSKNQPFVDTPAGMGYFGDDGQRLVQVSASRQMAASNPGADVFMRIKNGNGTFDTQADAANTGTATVSRGSVSNSALLTGDNYRVDFTVAAGVTTYSVTNTTPPGAVVIPAGTAYVSGQAISFDGIQFDIQGAPANGDKFTVAPSSNESVFKTISDLISALKTTTGTNLTNNLSRGINNLDNALDNVMSSRSSLGLRLVEIDGLETMGDNLGLQYKQTLSKLQETDYVKAISDLTQQKMNLEAAQQSFIKINQLSMFNYL